MEYHVNNIYHIISWNIMEYHGKLSFKNLNMVTVICQITRYDSTL